jgi:hypothetical protein
LSILSKLGERRDGRRLIGLDCFLEILIGNARLSMLGKTGITRNVRASRTKR